LSFLVLSCLVLSWLVLSCLVWSGLVLPCLSLVLLLVLQLELLTAKAALSNLLGGFVYAYGRVTVT
jgi:hypothetical protein